ncbi:hypothetical protein L6452_34130 [Arctium lappa]|uniref:Uncharacterized protein n=1 Tax=Arctium lappa TaxID=4217 RepID=A0ACB8YHB7_ARCLA|nr:hypothetical protein L6452_34130 [Arctium lappa]
MSLSQWHSRARSRGQGLTPATLTSDCAQGHYCESLSPQPPEMSFSRNKQLFLGRLLLWRFGSISGLKFEFLDLKTKNSQDPINSYEELARLIKLADRFRRLLSEFFKGGTTWDINDTVVHLYLFLHHNNLLHHLHNHRSSPPPLPSSTTSTNTDHHHLLSLPPSTATGSYHQPSSTTSTSSFTTTTTSSTTSTTTTHRHLHQSPPPIAAAVTDAHRQPPSLAATTVARHQPSLFPRIEFAEERPANCELFADTFLRIAYDKSKILTFARKNFIYKHCHDNSFKLHTIPPKSKVSRKASRAKSVSKSSTQHMKVFHVKNDYLSRKQKFNELNVKMVWKWIPKPRYEWRIKAKASHLWYIDSGCSRHMTGFKHLLHNYVEEPAGTVSFANSELTGFIRGHCSLTNGTITIKKVLFVDGLDHNLFSTSQFCDSKFQVRFTVDSCFLDDKDGCEIFKAERHGNLYEVHFPTLFATRPVCLIAKVSRAESWIWHRRLSHQNFQAINQLARHGIVKGLPELRFEKNSLCPACEMGKMKRSSHKAKT